VSLRKKDKKNKTTKKELLLDYKKEASIRYLKRNKTGINYTKNKKKKMKSGKRVKYVEPLLINLQWSLITHTVEQMKTF